MLVFVIEILVGCSDNKETPNWDEVLKNIRTTFSDVKYLQTDELYLWMTDSKHESVMLVDAREKKRVSGKPSFRGP